MSTEEQSLALQVGSLERAGCDELFTDHAVSGTRFDRPGLTAALSKAAEGDVLIVWRLDRLGRSLSNLVALIDHLGRRKIEFVSLTENINTRSSSGMLMFHMMAALAQFERELISERTKAGLAAARANGRQLGRRPALTAAQLQEAREMLTTVELEHVAKLYSVHPRTLTRVLKNLPAMHSP